VLEKNLDAPDTRSMDEIVLRLRLELPKSAADAELIVRRGSAPHVIAAFATEIASSLTVTGVARYNSIGDYFLGTAVNHIVRHSDIPFSVVNRRPANPYLSILAATDFSECSRHALMTAAQLFGALPITLVQAFHTSFESFLDSNRMRAYLAASAAADMKSFLESSAIELGALNRISTVVEYGDVGGVIFGQLAKTGTDLLVLGTHGQSVFAYAAVGSNAEALLSSAPCDVLMVRGANLQ